MTLGQRIQEQRKKLNLSQEALGEAMGVSRQAISKWEGDLTIPEIDKLIGLSKLFGISLNQLLGVEEPEAKSAEPASRDRRLVRTLTGLCAALALTTVLALGGVAALWEKKPLTAPNCPVTGVAYAVRPDYEARNVDVVLEIKTEGLRGWDTKLNAWMRSFDDRGTLVENAGEWESEVQLKWGKARVAIEDMPFSYVWDSRLDVSIFFEKRERGERQESGQNILSLAPEEWGGPWKVVDPYNTLQSVIEFTEDPELLKELD